MSTMKLIGLFLISFIAVGSIAYNISNRRPRPAVVATQPATAPLLRTAATPLPIALPQPRNSTVPIPSDKAGQRPNIPSVGWGRNPFLTIDEINKLNQPEL